MDSSSRIACDVCGKYFYTAQSLKMHTVRSHANEVSKQVDEVGSSQTVAKPAKASKTAGEVATSVPVGKPGKKGSVCTTCGLCLPNASRLAHHVEEVHKSQAVGRQVSCNICGMYFHNAHELTAHTQIIHTNEPKAKDQCTSCGRVFVNLANHKKCSGKLVPSNSSAAPDDADGLLPQRVTRSVTAWQQSHGGTTQNHQIKQKLQKELESLKTVCKKKTHTDDADPLLQKLTHYHNSVCLGADNILTEKLSAEVLAVISDVSKVGDVNREFQWSKDDELRLNALNWQVKDLKTPSKWTWAAKEGTDQFTYNHKRMQYLVEHELETVIKHCDKCKSTGILVGKDQVDAAYCYDCMSERRCSEKLKSERSDAWTTVRPPSLEYHGLPKLYAGDKAVLALVHPVVTVRKNYMISTKLRQESITLMNDVNQTWTKILPRMDLKDRFVVIERTSKDHSRKHIVANPDRVRVWLKFLFRNHTEFIRMEKDGELKMSEEALEVLQSQSELGEVVDDLEYEEASDNESDKDTNRNVSVIQPAMESGFSSSDVYTFDRYPYLYLKSKDFLRIKQSGEMQIIEDHQQRVPIYKASATVAFPYLYSASGMKSPLDFRDFKMCRYLLKKQTVFAYKLADSKYKWEYAEDDIHMMYQYARLVEKMVSAKTAWYLQQSPDVAHLPINQVLEAFKTGFVSEDASLLESHLHGLSSVMVKLPNSRQHWFSERLGIEAISRDFGDPNLFITLNNSPRDTYDTRLLLHRLEHGSDVDFNANYYEQDVERFTNLMNRYAPQMSVYLYRKTRMFLKAFLCDICGVPEQEPSGDWMYRDRQEESYYWSRSEFTSTRGIQHWHCLVKLPHVLDTGVVGRMIQNGRVVRQELKCGNIQPEKIEEAWEMVEVGLLANRYATLFADSLSLASFYTEAMDVDSHDAAKVIDVDKIRDEFVNNYKEKRIDMATHPVMRRFCDREYCDENRYVEMAKIAAVSCMHNCIQTVCGGEPKTGKGCRFDFPKATLNHTVPAIMQVNSSMMEARMLLRRTCARVPNLNEYLLLYWRTNHDMTVLIDASHKMRYATKYAAKSGKYSELLNEIIEYLSQRSVGSMPPNMQVVLSQLLLADVSHRSFMTKQELSYHVMQLPDVKRTFTNVDVVGFYHRAYLNISSANDDGIITYSDRTEYCAYAERCRDSTEIMNRKNIRHENVLTKDVLARMCFREFAETVNHEWIKDRSAVPEEIGQSSKRKFMSRDVSSGHWVLKRRMKRRHIRFSTVLYTDAPALYEPADLSDATTFFDLPTDKRKQLYRAYMEMVCYIPWKDSPEESFLDEEQRAVLQDALQDPEKDRRYSLRRLEMFWEVYMDRFRRGEIAPPGSEWWRDNQYAYSMFLTTRHNVDVHMRRLEHDGTLSATYEADDEVKETGVDLHFNIHDKADHVEYPSALNFLPPDTFREILEQVPPEPTDVKVAFPSCIDYQDMEHLVKSSSCKLFLAKPPLCSVSDDDMTVVQKWAVGLGVDINQQILYLCGKAGSGKTQVALKICELFAGHVQAAAVTGKAASVLGAPTVHGMFNWGTYDRSQSGDVPSMNSRKASELRCFYENVDIFVIDEVNAMSATMLAQVHETMTLLFNPDLEKVGGNVLPFGGKKMVFLGDPVQLKPVMGEPIYGGGMAGAEKALRVRSARGRRQNVYHTTAKGQELYRKYLLPNCVMLCRGQRSSGLLQQICDRLRKCEEKEEDRAVLLYQGRNYSDFTPDFALHYDNESCASSNWQQLWSDCKSCDPPKRLCVCRATYHTTLENHQVVDGLAALPSKLYKFAPDVLCVAVGGEVRLVKNMNVAAGLVNSATGTVVCVLYDNADCSALLAGNHPPPYCIIVSFSGFRGFEMKDKRVVYPFPNNPHWVPVYRERFVVARSDLPSWIVQRQEPRDCWREQFPLDLCGAMTCHRAQGQTLSDCSVGVDLGLDNLERQLPNDIRSILYVALTRATQLKDVLVRYISPTVWQRLKNAEDNRDVEASLVDNAKEFASSKGMLDAVIDELQFQPDYGDCEQELQDLKGGKLQPSRRQPVSIAVSDGDLVAETSRGRFDMLATVVQKERHIGVDQGRRNFAMVAVDKEVGQEPVVVAARRYDLALGPRLRASDVMVKLKNCTDLWSWMQQTGERALPDVDRVVVCIEQMSAKNANWKQFGPELCKMLQKCVIDEHKCIVKLSQPHLFRPGGVIECLGEQIVQELGLVTVACGRKRSLSTAASAVKSTATSVTTTAKRTLTHCDDVEPDDDEEDNDADNDDMDDDHDVDNDSDVDDDINIRDPDYRRKKRMSANIFRYFVEADSTKEQDMKVSVCAEVRDMWRHACMQDHKAKLDDLGDALLHALSNILCGSKYRQLVSSSVSVRDNRTVVVSVGKKHTFWAVIHCTWNTFELEDVGCDLTVLSSQYFNSDETVADIRQSLLGHLQTALTDPSGGDLYRSVDVIKMVVKQLKGFMDFTHKQAGTLTNSTVRALRSICDEAAGANSEVCQSTDKTMGSVYTRTQHPTGHKFQVVRSTGKLTNAMLSCLNWMHENATEFVEKRMAFMDERTKLSFFCSLQSMAESGDKQMENVVLSEHAKAKLAGDDLRHLDNSMKGMLAYLILIGINKNGYLVKAVAANYRRPAAVKTRKNVLKPSLAESEGDAVVDVDSHPGTSGENR